MRNSCRATCRERGRLKHLSPQDKKHLSPEKSNTGRLLSSGVDLEKCDWWVGPSVGGGASGHRAHVNQRPITNQFYRGCFSLGGGGRSRSTVLTTECFPVRSGSTQQTFCSFFFDFFTFLGKVHAIICLLKNRVINVLQNITIFCSSLFTPHLLTSKSFIENGFLIPQFRR